MKSLNVLLIFLLAVLTVISPVMAQAIPSTVVNNFAVNDTTIATANNSMGGIASANAYGSCVLINNTFVNTSQAYGSCTKLLLAQSGGSQAWMKFDLGEAVDNVITSAIMQVFNTTSESGGTVVVGWSSSFTISSISNTSWDENTATGIIPYVVTPTDVAITSASLSVTGTSSQFANASVMMANIYGGTGSLRTLGITGGVASRAFAAREETGTLDPLITVNYTSFKTVSVLTTDVSTIYFDFETMTVSNSTSSTADFSYDVANNILYPIQPAVFRITENTNANTLSQIACADPSSSYSTAPIVDLHIPSDAYDIICFNLSSPHAGRNFVGAIKVLNTTNVRGGAANDLDFYAAIYAPNYIIFSTLSLSPNPPQSRANLTISWETSQGLTTSLRYRYVDPFTHTLTSFSTVTGNQNFSTQHSVNISGTAIVSTGIFYEYQLFGTSINGTTFSSRFFNFTTVDAQETISTLTTGINIIVANKFRQTTNPVTGLVTHAPVQATVTISGCGGTDQPNGVPLQAVVTPTANGSYASVASCDLLADSFGAHNVTVTANGFQSERLQINVTTNPFFYTVYLIQIDCQQILETQLNNVCEFQMNQYASTNWQPFQFQNVTSWACVQNSLGCLTKDVNGNPNCGQTFPFGTYIGYVCTGNVTYLNLGLVNTTINASQIGGAQAGGSALPPLTQPFTDLLGLSADDAKAMFAMIITLIFTIAVGVKTKDGFVTSLIFLGFISLFLVMQWLPVWIWALLFILSAAIATSAAKKVFTPTPN